MYYRNHQVSRAWTAFGDEVCIQFSTFQMVPFKNKQVFECPHAPWSIQIKPFHNKTTTLHTTGSIRSPYKMIRPGFPPHILQYTHSHLTHIQLYSLTHIHAACSCTLSRLCILLLVSTYPLTPPTHTHSPTTPPDVTTWRPTVTKKTQHHTDLGCKTQWPPDKNPVLDKYPVKTQQ